MSAPQDQTLPMAISPSTEATTGVAESNRLATAKHKLSEGGFDLDNLPFTRSSTLWDHIETTYQLTLEELSALKNGACPLGPLLPLRSNMFGDGTLFYKIHADHRHRVQFTISKETYPQECSMDTMELFVDPGSNTELILPAGKVLELGLSPRGGRRIASLNSVNDIICCVQTFSPVFVQATFHRQDGVVQETVGADLTVQCVRKEHDAMLVCAPSGLSGNHPVDGLHKNITPTVDISQVTSNNDTEPFNSESHANKNGAPTTSTSGSHWDSGIEETGVASREQS